MASISYIFIVLSLLASSAKANLATNFYAETCPKLEEIVLAGVTKAVAKEKRMAASLLRLYFHDCFVTGCDASILLDDTPTFKGEKNAGPNANSARGYEVIDDIKTEVEAACNGTVSCADIFSIAVRDGISLLGGPNWAVPLGRKDSTTASEEEANSGLPGPDSDLATLISMFREKGFTAQEMATLSGAHTIGKASCGFFRTRIHQGADIDPAFAEELKADCPLSGGATNLAPLDSTTDVFDNQYYIDLTEKRGLFASDQALFSGGSLDGSVQVYSKNPAAFTRDFAKVMIKLSNLLPASDAATEIRLNCRAVNKA